jgi:MFS family permease
MDSIRNYGRETFASLSIHNYRLYFFGQGISLCGTWMQTVALGWLMLQLTGSGIALGNVLAVQYLPIFLGAFFAGSVVDRFEKRRILYVTQSTLAILALGLSILVFSGAVQVWMVYLFALLMGTASSVDNPTRQTFVHEMVGPDHLRNAVTLLSTIANIARAIGPLVAGLLIASVGIAFCFFMNALSFLAVLFVLVLIDADELQVPGKPHHSVKGYFLPVIIYIKEHQELLRILVTMFFVGTFTYEFPVSLPLLAQRVFLGDASSYALLLSGMGLGSVLGGLYIARRREISMREFSLAALCFGASICLTSLMPTLASTFLGMIFVGFFSIELTSTGATILQLESEEFIRGRVMALWSMAIFGTTLFGAPLIGFIAEHISPRFGLGIGGITALCAGVILSFELAPIVHVLKRKETL